MEGGARRLRYEPALDGVRAIAVLAVVAYHLGWSWAPGGFLGVDVFFVLSGYLITGLLVAEWGARHRISLVGFYARRVRRLLPALFVLLVAVAVFWAVAVPSDELGGLRRDGIASLLYYANWHFTYSGQSYFALVAAPSPLRHVWSLAIEEQFYLLWPLTVMAAMAVGRGSRRVLAGVCGLGVVASVVLTVVLFRAADPSRVYYGTDTRAHELLVGALFALVPAGSAAQRWFSSRAARAVGLLAAGGCVAAFAVVSDHDQAYYHGGSLLFAMLVGLVIVTSIGPVRAGVASGLASAPLVWVGLRSYGIYLWHWPVIVYLTEGRTGLRGTALDLARIALTLAIAAVSFKVVERPIREQRVVLPVRRLAVPVAFVVALATILVGTSGATTPAPYLRAKPGTVLQGPGARGPDGARSAKVELVGDSVAASIQSALGRALSRVGFSMQAATVPGCGLVEGVVLDAHGDPYPFADACARVVPSAAIGAVASARPDFVLWLSAWETQDRVIGGHVVRLGTPDGDAEMLQAIDRSVTGLTATGARLLLVTPPPTVNGDERRITPDETRRYLLLDTLLRRYADAHRDRVRIVELAKIVCPGGPPCPQTVHGVRLRPRDGSHFEGAGATWVSARLAALIERCATLPTSLSCGVPDR